MLVQIFYLYTQHRTYVIDEMIQLLLKLPHSKRALRTYYIRDEEQKQIQMVTALLIQLIQCSANIPDALRQASSGNAVLEVSVDANYPTKCLEAATEAGCLFWSRVLQRFASVKTQDASELKSIMENLVTDLLTTLNLPEYPASAPFLEVVFMCACMQRSACFFVCYHSFVLVNVSDYFTSESSFRFSVSYYFRMLGSNPRISLHVPWQLIFLVQLLQG